MNFTTQGASRDDVQECTEFFLKNGKSITKWINITDKHMQTFVKDPEAFLLPKAHSFLRPLIERYAKHTEGFAWYLIELRDQFSKEDAAWERVQAVYRRINGRVVQQLRRQRSNKAIAVAEKLYGATDYHTRLQWVSNLEHKWAQRRLKFLDQYRSKTGDERIDTETRAELLAEFWEIIDTEIFEKKEIPKWN